MIAMIAILALIDLIGSTSSFANIWSIISGLGFVSDTQAII